MTCNFTFSLTVVQSYQDDTNDDIERLCAMEFRLRLRSLKEPRLQNASRIYITDYA